MSDAKAREEDPDTGPVADLDAAVEEADLETVKPAGLLRKNRDFRLLWIGQSLSNLGGSVSGVAFPLLVLALTGSATKAGIAGFAANAPFVLLQLPAGAYVDRWNRRAVMLWSDVGRALALASVVVALLLGSLTFAHILVVAVIETSLFVTFRLAEGAALRTIVSDEAQLGSAIALNQARGYGTSLAGEPLGGLLFGLRQALPFAFDCISYVASLITVASIRTPLPAPSSTASRQLRREIKEGLRVAWDNVFLRTVSILSAGSDFVINGLFLVLIVITVRGGASSSQVGLMLAIGGAGGLIGALAASWAAERVPSVRFVVVGVSTVAVLPILLMATTDDPYVLGALLGVILSVWPLYNAVVVSRWMTQVPDELMGRVQAAVAVLGWAPVPVAPILGGFLLDQVGNGPTVLIFAGVMAAVATVVALSKAVRHESTRATS